MQATRTIFARCRAMRATSSFAGTSAIAATFRHNSRHMVTQAKIVELSRRIARRFAPERIILFGSRAHGKPRHDSDVDLLVVMRFRGLSARKAAEILNAVEPEFPVDLIVRTPRELRRRLAQDDPFLGEIVRRGTVLHESDRH